MDAADTKILIVEDDPQIRMMLQKFLSKHGYQIVVADDGLKGVKCFNEEHPHLVLLDTLLPKLMGFDVCDMIKGTPEGKSTPVVMMSAVCRAEKFQTEAKSKHRADHFLVKPFQFTEMIQVIEGLLGQSKETATMSAAKPSGAKSTAIGVAQRARAVGEQTIVAGPSSTFVASPPPMPSAPVPSPRQTGSARPPWGAPPVVPAASDVLDIVDGAPPEEPIELDESELTPIATSLPVAPPPAPEKAITYSRPASTRSASAAPRVEYEPERTPAPRPATAAPKNAAAGQERLFEGLEDFEIPELETNRGRGGQIEADAADGASSEAMIVEFETDDAEETTSAGRSLAPSRGGPEVEIEFTPRPSPAPFPTPPAPTLTGDVGYGLSTPQRPTEPLGALPLGALFQALGAESFSGALDVTHEGTTRRVLWQQGRVAFVEPLSRSENVGRFLVKAGRLGDAAYSKALEVMMESGGSIEDALVESGAVAAGDLPKIVDDVVSDRAASLFEWGESTYQTTPGAPLTTGTKSTNSDPVVVAFHALSRRLPDDWVASKMASLRAQRLTVTDAFKRVAGRLTDLQIPGALLEGLGKLTVAEMVGVNPTQSAASLRCLRAMIELGFVAPESGPASEPASKPSTPSPGISSAADSPDLIARITAVHPRLGQIDYFSLLGVSQNASAEEIETAYWSLARGLAPDQIAKYPADVQRRVREFATKLSVAFGTLSDPTHRAEYLAKRLRESDTSVPTSPPPAPPQSAAPSETPTAPSPESAEAYFRRGEKLLKEGAFATALVAFTNALKANPKEPDHYLYLGWAMYQNYRGSGRADMETRAVNFVRRALVMNPNLDQGYYLLGRIYHEKGKADQAKQLYAKAIFINPSHGEALAAMRALPK